MKSQDTGPQDPSDIVLSRDAVRETAAKLYGQGVPRAKIARALVDHLVPNRKHRPLEQRLSQARTKLRSWERDQKFRDKVYDMAVVKLDIEIPGILQGVARKAKRGRVDAARLALEVTGRHNPKGDANPPSVAVVINGMPRPQGTQVVQADLEIDEDDVTMVREEPEEDG
jgi:hypothetical protein